MQRNVVPEPVAAAVVAGQNPARLPEPGTRTSLLWRAKVGDLRVFNHDIGKDAGTYMPGLKLLTDRIQGPLQLRAVPYYTASFSLGASFSYLLASEAAKWLGWAGAFALAGVSSIGAFALVLLFVTGMHPTSSGTARAVFNFRPVVRDSSVMSYVLAYGGHS